MEVAPAHYLVVAGRGEPAPASLRSAAERLLRSGAVVQALHRAAGHDFALPPLELLIWSSPHKLWKLLLRMPESVGAAQVKNAQDAQRVHSRTPRGVALERLDEGLCLQVTAEAAAGSALLLAKAQALGMRLGGPQHQIYAAGKQPLIDPPSLIRHSLLGADGSMPEVGPRQHRTRARREFAFREHVAPPPPRRPGGRSLKARA
jgi:hypothetical protein